MNSAKSVQPDLEQQLQRHLDGPWATGLIDGVQPDAAHIASQASSEHRVRASKESAVEIGDVIAKIRSIEDIKGTHPELQVHSFRKSETPTQRQIQLP